MTNNVANTSTFISTSTTSLPTVEELDGWDRERIKRFLQEKRDELELEENDIDVIYDQRVSGRAFLRLNEQQLTRNSGPFELPYGPASAIAELVKKIKRDQSITVRSLTGSKDDLYIFVNDSNLYIEGKFVVGEYEQIGTFDNKRKQLRFDQLRIDYGQVLRVLQNGRNLGGDPIVVGSVSPTDSIWNLVQKEGFRVTTFPQNAEKMVDLQIGHYIDGVLYNKVPAVLALITGDSNFKPILQTAVQLGWTVEIYFWETAYLCKILEISSHLFDPNSNNPDYISLNQFYKSITYGYGPEIQYYGCSQMKLLQLSGQVISNWKINEIMKFFEDLEIFGWWYRQYDLLWIHFKNMDDLRNAEDLLRNNYSQIRFQRQSYNYNY